MSQPEEVFGNVEYFNESYFATASQREPPAFLRKKLYPGSRLLKIWRGTSGLQPIEEDWYRRRWCGGPRSASWHARQELLKNRGPGACSIRPPKPVSGTAIVTTTNLATGRTTRTTAEGTGVLRECIETTAPDRSP